MSWVTEEESVIVVCFVFSSALGRLFLSVALLACPFHAVFWQRLHFFCNAASACLDSLAGFPMTDLDTWWFLRREGVRLRGRLFMLVFTLFFMSSLFPTLRGGDGMGVGEAGDWGSAL